MYRFSRSIYRQLAPRIEARDDFAGSAARQHLIEACEETVMRLATDRHFARPARTLFREVRNHFALTDQVYVHMVIERYIDLATSYLESLPDDLILDGRPRHCPASTRKGTPCQREPRPGREYCPSHMHLEDVFEALEPAPVSQAA